MPLNFGDIQATSGLSKGIYQELRDQLEPQFSDMSDMKEKDLNKVREGWQKLAYAIAKGVVEHIKSNMEIKGVEVVISDVSTNVSVATTCPSGAGSGTGTGSGTATGQQSNSGTGLVK